MLLRRVTQHVNSQNWFAVFVDFVIVVVGVFVGLQVQDWNDSRKERAEEDILLARLLVETQALFDIHEQELESFRSRASILTGVNPILFSQEPGREITDSECRVIAGSHSYRRPSDEIPVLDEMLETGRFDLLRDTELKNQLRSYVLLRERGRAYYGEAVNELFRLHSRFPSVITVRRLPTSSGSDANWGGLSGEGYQWVPECDVDRMRENTAFLNEYVDNVSRINSLMSFVKQRRDYLMDIRARLRGQAEKNNRSD